MSAVATPLNKLQVEAILFLEKEWAEACPDHRCPHDSWFIGLVQANGLAASEYAVRRLGRKLFAARHAGESVMTLENAKQYCSAVAKNTASGQFPDRQAPAREKMG
jgi:hypothetical protein